MAELATLARPYAEALYQVARQSGAANLGEVLAQVDALAAVAADPQLRQLADHPKVQPAQVFEVVSAAAKRPLSEPVQNFLRALIDNGRLMVLPQIAAQFQVLVNAQAGVHDAHIASAFPIEPGQLPSVMAALEKRFGRKLNPLVTLQPELIGGIRVVVGDEVLDTSIQARLQQMNVALTA